MPLSRLELLGRGLHRLRVLHAAEHASRLLPGGDLLLHHGAIGPFARATRGEQQQERQETTHGPRPRTTDKTRQPSIWETVATKPATALPGRVIRRRWSR